MAPASFFASVVASVTGIKVVLFLVVLLAVAVWFILKELREKEELKLLLEKAVQGKPISPNEIKKLEPQLNQVYLKREEKLEYPALNAANPIYKIVITGGPCGGKSTSLTKIQEEMAKKGFRVFSVPEIPTLVVQAGGFILMSKFSIEERIKFQSLLIRFQIYAEDYFTQLALMSKSPSIIICDRGTCDPAAYVSKEEFQAIMDEEGWTWTTLRDKRYDGVLHLVTAAIGAEEFYTRSNNTARSEGLETARALDKKTLDAWTGHPHIVVCPNIKGETFDKKLTHAIRGVYKIVGIDLLTNRYEKFIIHRRTSPSTQPTIQPA
jgi:predicted ATPase